VPTSCISSHIFSSILFPPPPLFCFFSLSCSSKCLLTRHRCGRKTAQRSAPPLSLSRTQDSTSLRPLALGAPQVEIRPTGEGFDDLWRLSSLPYSTFPEILTRWKWLPAKKWRSLTLAVQRICAPPQFAVARKQPMVYSTITEPFPSRCPAGDPPRASPYLMWAALASFGPPPALCSCCASLYSLGTTSPSRSLRLYPSPG